MQNTELLLEQMAALLERALAARTEWYRLNAAAFNVRLNLDQYFELDQIHQEETVSGFYDHTPREAELQAAADFLTQINVQGQLSALEGIGHAFYSPAAVTAFINNSVLLAYLSHLADYSTQAQGNFMQYTSFDNKTHEESYKLAESATQYLGANSVNLQQAWLATQTAATQGNVSVSDQKARASSVKSAWEAKNAGFRLRRTEVSRHLADVKADAYTSPGGALNYPEQMKLIEARFRRDFRDALARVNAAAEGVQKLYGFSEPVPRSVTSILAGQPADAGAYDDCLNWARNARSFLSRFAQTDQRYSHPVSLKARINDDAFKQGRKLRDWATWTVDVPRQLFEGQYYVRLRGVTLYVVGDPSAGVFTGKVQVPAMSFCELFPKAPGAQPQHQDLDQSHISPAMGGRITNRENVRIPDVIGASAFYNASPFGTWAIKLFGTSEQGVSVDKIEDVVLEMHLAVRMAA